MHPYIEIIALELTSKNICPDDLRAFILHFFYILCFTNFYTYCKIMVKKGRKTHSKE